MNKSTVAEIRTRFDTHVKYYSNLETGQVAAVDGAIMLEMVTEVVKRLYPAANRLLDVGCGAGNYTLKMLSKLPQLECTLIDLSSKMLAKAEERISPIIEKPLKIFQTDIRTALLESEYYDVILAGAVLHHLREDNDWEHVFNKLYTTLKPGGCLIISDLIEHESAVLNRYIRELYMAYLESRGGADYRAKVMNYIDNEDSPRSINYQFDLLKRIGFKKMEVLHKNMCFATYYAVK